MKTARTTTVTALPEDMTVEVLSQLPIKTLARFRCVCKQWNSLVLRMTTKKLLISTSHSVKALDYELRFGDEHALIDLDFPFKYPDNPLVIWGSCRGLVCVSVKKFGEIYLWNPSTGVTRKLPNPRIDDVIIDDYSSCYSYGFGYDSVYGDFKVVLVSKSHCCNYNPRSYVFSLKANSWKCLPNISSAGDGIWTWKFQTIGLFLNGAIHWKRSSDPVAPIVAFDLASELFYKVPLPDCASSGEGAQIVFERLGIADGLLCLTRFDCLDLFIADIWVMKEYGKSASWVKDGGGSLWCPHWVLPLCKAERGYLLLDPVRDGLIMCHPGGTVHTKKRFQVRTKGDPYDYFAVPYEESLISPFTWNQQEQE